MPRGSAPRSGDAGATATATRDDPTHDILPLPKYQQVYLVLRQRLLDGDYDAGLPGEMNLAQEFGMSRVTVRRALEILVRQQLIERSRRTGTRRTSSGRKSPDIVAPESAMAGEGTPIDEVIEQGIVCASRSLAASLQITEGDAVHRMAQLRRTAAGPACYTVSWAPSISGSSRRLQRAALCVHLPTASALQWVSARHADTLVAHHLDVPVGQAVLVLEYVSLDGRGRPAVRQRMVWRSDRCGFPFSDDDRRRTGRLTCCPGDT